MKPIENMSDVELIETVLESQLDYDFRIHAAKQILIRVGVIKHAESSGLQCPDGRNI